jgi:hypothetical protein
VKITDARIQMNLDRKGASDLIRDLAGSLATDDETIALTVDVYSRPSGDIAAAIGSNGFGAVGNVVWAHALDKEATD